MNSREIINRGQNDLQRNKKLFQRLKKIHASHTDRIFREAHEDVFSNTNCLACANCCKTTSPIFREKDIERIASFLRMTPGDFSQKFLKTDEDHDKVLKETPCPFLGPDNVCAIYEVRPLACQNYPHTHRKNIMALAHLTLNNSLICPAVQEILKKVNEKISKWN
ncbi:MAG: YkgJ family cysteine cluster protein [Bacteroidia bacterium]|nr:YkgJ family cysteine cluster protein [Bacteroidia bacterium]